MGRVGFEPTQRNAADLQSAPFNHSGIDPSQRDFNKFNTKTQYIKNFMRKFVAFNKLSQS